MSNAIVFYVSGHGYGHASRVIEVVNAMNPRRMSDILGQMTPEVVERLTMEIANRSGAVDKAAAPTELPKIEGRPSKS